MPHSPFFFFSGAPPCRAIRARVASPNKTRLGREPPTMLVAETNSQTQTRRAPKRRRAAVRRISAPVVGRSSCRRAVRCDWKTSADTARAFIATYHISKYIQCPLVRLNAYAYSIWMHRTAGRVPYARMLRRSFALCAPTMRVTLFQTMLRRFLKIEKTKRKKESART